MKGIILAGGKATRLYPVTRAVTKQLLPIYDKPTIYYPLSTLMLAGITEILIISSRRDVPALESLLGNGNKLGLHIEYAIQENPNGLAEAFILGERFLNNEPCCLVLGDNFFYGAELGRHVTESARLVTGAEIYAYHVKNPESFGIVTFDKDLRPLTLVEKPKNAASNWAVTGLYFLDGLASQYAKTLKPSARGELEITDLLNLYLKNDQLRLKPLGRGYAWLDTGTFDSLMEASQFVATVERRQGYKIACLEEIAFRQGLISTETLRTLSKECENSGYGAYLLNLLEPDF